MKLGVEDKRLLEELCNQYKVSYEKITKILKIVQDFEFKDRRAGIYDAYKDVLIDKREN